MKCDICPYLYRPEYESSYTSCRVFGDEIPEKFERKDGEGCKCNSLQLRKLLKISEEAWMKEADQFVKWFESQKEINSSQNITTRN